ncbi:uncharacterized protein MEPE_01252 [Melanopsichium pennsylvanicum]|uniref:Golgi apparatus membrane protein TVP38 n=2 Tax=Melanopsichium pennsylvanicum TaxID=63383 RepID=A0AAJ5C3E6_9BASI|nr:conserved hypothetical protein [Melanopsichium pennsylvanicum 4]SNX82546.1 uncharacterized protein MEPE_01252 [Melanopsichium pennsylvanicum]
MPASHPHRARYAPLRQDTHPATAIYTSYIRSAYLQGRSYLDQTYQTFLSLPTEQRNIIYLAVGVKALIFGVVLYIGPEAMFDATAKLAIWFGSRSFGAVLLVALIIIVSFPPLIGYGTSITLCGLGWGVHAEATSSHPELKGNLLQAWLLASISCLLGATVSFFVLRFLIVHHSKRVSWISNTLNDPKYVALSTAVRRRGLSMAILIRFCPFPFAYSNLFFASLVDAVTFTHFVTATALITPKLFLHVWLGTRMFILMDRDQRMQLDGWAKALNVIYILVGSAVGVATGWFVWKETNKVLTAIESESLQEHIREDTQTGGSRRIGASESHQHATTQESYHDIEQNANKNDQATSPFILDADEDDTEDESQNDSVGSAAKKNLLPR